MNMTEEKLESSLQCMGKEENFLNITPVAQTLRATINDNLTKSNLQI